MTRKEQELLCKYKIFESRRITFSDQKEYNNFRELINTLSLNKDATKRTIDIIIKTWEEEYPRNYFQRFQQARITNFDIEDYFIKLIRKYNYEFLQESTTMRNPKLKDQEESDEDKLIIIDSEGEEVTLEEPEKRIITKLSKLSLSKLLDLKETSELSPDQYRITKNTLFYLKQQENLKIQGFLGQEPNTTKENYLNTGTPSMITLMHTLIK
ncbi:hypothetical protein C2G38_2207570 [Gigaspora rosea]|uniref:Uncharacterized protein n=1 Tax=Gigaspora rosea TaxID=44941 RepID=A0A397UHX8_9GLOM|nr:hypothetical protein C2G38_2207570 [Gigaspora rosea]